MNAAPDSLNIPGLRVLSRQEIEGQYLYDAEVTASAPQPCCLLRNTVKNGRKPQHFRDFAEHGRYVEVRIKRQRFKCLECGLVTYEEVPGLIGRHRMTKRLHDSIIKHVANTTFADVSRQTGVSEATIRALFNDHIEEQFADYSYPTPSVLGIDEKHINKKYRCVVGDVQNRALLDILPSRYKEDLVRYFEAMPDRDKVEVVCQDMYDPYRSISRHFFPKAQVVIDKFHVVMMANEAIEKARRRCADGLSIKDRRILKTQRSLFERRFYTLKPYEQEKVAYWLDRLPRLAEAYRIKEDMLEMYRCTTKAEAIQHYRQWEATLVQDTGTYFAAIPTAMKRWSGNIFNYFDHPYTNAYTESVNRLIGDMHRNGRGYSFPVLRAKAILAHGLSKTAAPKFKKVDRPRTLFIQSAPPLVDLTDHKLLADDGWRAYAERFDVNIRSFLSTSARSQPAPVDNR